VTAPDGAAATPARSPCAVILSGSVLGYSIVQELAENGVRDVVLCDTERRFGSYSRRLREFRRIGPTVADLRAVLLDLRRSHDRIVLFPTYDHHLTQLLEIREDVREFCFLPFNAANLLASLEKLNQYEACHRLGVPCPRTRPIRSMGEYEVLAEVPLPILLKPQHKTGFGMRPFEVDSPATLDARRPHVQQHLSQGIELLASELIPGDGSNIHAYVGFRTGDGRILGEWAGHKLSQHPHEFGVFASATNGSAPAVTEQGRTLLEGMDLQGIVEPEFKYDARDGRYKLTEINLRSMMWSRVGALSGVPIHYVQWLHATGRAVPRYRQALEPRVHYIYLNNEVSNLFFRRGYWKTFRHVIWGGERRVIAVFDRRDPRPFLVSLWGLVFEIWTRCRERFAPG
jgi:D-aspartate ligase